MIHSRRLGICYLFISFFTAFLVSAQVKPGADLLFQKHRTLIEGKRLGLITNHTAVLSNGTHLADTLRLLVGAYLVALFGPEHGIRGTAAAGEHIEHTIDEKTGIPLYSLYADVRKPTAAMLADVDMLLYDIQDVGVRFFTYVSTLALAMEAAAERGIPFVVLDRPNPTGGTWVEGFVREDSLRSFLGWLPIPLVYGMTVGELATMINQEGWLRQGLKVNLTVIRMEGWKRGMWYDRTGLRWINPSPNMKTLATAMVYPGTCLIEGTNISEGRGTERPFEYVGAPFVRGKELAERMNAYDLPGVTFEPIAFTPQDIPGVALNVKHKGARCEGVYVKVVDRNKFEPVKTGVFLLSALKSLYPTDFKWRERATDLLAGTPVLRRMIDANIAPQQIVTGWNEEVKRFLNRRKQFLLYD